jgi:hypothetical protein
MPGLLLQKAAMSDSSPQMVPGDVGKVQVGERRIDAVSELRMRPADLVRDHLIELQTVLRAMQGRQDSFIAAVQATTKLLSTYNWSEQDFGVGQIAASQLRDALDDLRGVNLGAWVENIRVYLEQQWTPNVACGVPGVYRSEPVPLWDEAKLAAIVAEAQDE